MLFKQFNQPDLKESEKTFFSGSGIANDNRNIFLSLEKYLRPVRLEQ